MSRAAIAGLVPLVLLLAGCTSTRASDPLPAPIPGTVIVHAERVKATGTPPAETTVPVHVGLASEPHRPGVAFRVLPHRPGDRSLRIAWVDGGDPACGLVSGIWVHETTMQIVVTVYEPPRLSNSDGTGCPAQGVMHVQAVPLREPIADRTTNAFPVIPALPSF